MMSTINGEVQGAKLTGFQSDHISPDFTDAEETTNQLGCDKHKQGDEAPLRSLCRRECFLKNVCSQFRNQEHTSRAHRNTDSHNPKQ